ncbi:MAG: hypothetical protein ACT4O2_06070 [Beijerinckiaceae bacterium]
MDSKIYLNEFILEEADHSTILVRHLFAGVRFLFVIRGRRLDGHMGHAPRHVDRSVQNQARIFALHEARLRGFVD